MMKGKYFKTGDLIIYGTLLVIFILGTVMVIGSKQISSTTAVVTLDGEEIHRINLGLVDEPYEFRVETTQGDYNIIRVENGRIRVVEASCPDKIDVKQGWISNAHQSIVCLPNRLVIRIIQDKPETDSTIDGLAF